MIDRISAFLRRHITQQGTMGELETELRMREAGRERPTRRKTARRARHAHRAAGAGRRRRGYLPAITAIFKRRRIRPACRFVYARASRQATRDARLRVISNNDRMENALQRSRLERSGLAA